MRLKVAMFRLFVATVFILSASILPAQQKEISGTVKDAASGQPIAGSTVGVKGSTAATQTNSTGDFSISVPGPNARLVISSVGFEPQEITLSGRNILPVSLKKTISSLSEVVVTGYTSQRKKDITGSVAVVNVGDLESVPANSVENQLQGRAAGVTVVQDNEPGSVAKVRIRGFASFNGNDPLYIVDGVPTGSLLGINPGDVESMQILKDASSASIYGSRASNGVVIITTKKGRSGGAKVTYDMSYGVQDPGKGYTNNLNPQEEADLTWLALKNSGQQLTNGQFGSGPTPVLPDYLLGGSSSGLFEGDPDADPSLYDLDFNQLGDNNYSPYLIVKANKQGTDWYKALTRQAPMMNHNLTVSGGSADKSRYMFSFNYFDKDGVLINNFYKRYTVRANTEFNVKRNIRIGENIQIYSSEGNSAVGNNAYTELGYAYRMRTIIPVYNINGDFAGTRGLNLGDGHNPVAIRERAKNNRGFNFNLFGNMYAEVDLFKHFTARTSFGGTYTTSNYYNYPAIEYENTENNVSRVYSEGFAKSRQWVWTNQLTYKNTFGKHNVQAFVGVEAVDDNGRQIDGSRSDYSTYTNLNYINLNTGSGQQLVNGGPYNESSLFSEFARVDYDYNGKYIVSGTIRRDGSSRFSPSNRYGYFPAGSVGWRVSQESFMQNISWLTDLKLRGSYGAMGNQRIDAANQYTQFGGSNGASFYDIGGTSTSAAPGIYVSFIGNSAGKWETNVTSNIGFDASLFNGSTNITFDIYQKKTKNLLYNAEQPATAGGTASGNPPAFNIASMKNHGIDIALTQRADVGGKNGVHLDGTLTFTTYKNKITSIAEGVTSFDYDYEGMSGLLSGVFIRNAVGHPIASYFGYKVGGLFQSDEDVSKSPTQTDAAPGRFKYQDANGDGAVTDADRVFFGDPNPDFSYGINLNVAYKAFDLSAFFYGVQGADAINFVRWFTDFYPSFQGAKSKDALYNSWSPTNTNAKVPIQENAGNFSTNGVPNSYYMEDASYFRLKNLSLGYNLPNRLLNKIKIDKFRVYVQATNLFTITKYTGLDPEITNFDDRAAGIDAGSYPSVKQYIIGANISF